MPGGMGRRPHLCNSLCKGGRLWQHAPNRAGKGTGMRVVLAMLACLWAGAAMAADPLRVGLLNTLSPAPLYIAMQEGYFRDEGIDASFRFFEAAQPIAAAAVSGDIDVGVTALTGGFYSLAGRGTLKVIGGGLHEEPGVEGTAVLASRKAYDAGLTSLAKLPGHSMGITQFGASFHYISGRIAEKEEFDLKTVTLRPLQSIGNMIAAVRTNQVDATMAIGSQAKPLEAAGEAKIIAWVGDVTPYQLTAVFAPVAAIRDHADLLHRFARAYARGVDEYQAAFFRRGPDGKPVHDARTDKAIAAIQAYVFKGDPAGPQKILDGVAPYSPGGRLDVADVAAQLRWFVAQGLVKTSAQPSELIDTSFLGAMPNQ